MAVCYFLILTLIKLAIKLNSEFKKENSYQSKIFVSLKEYKGEITEIDGDEITVKANVRTYIFHRHEIMPLAAPSPIAYLLVGSCRCPITKGVNICAG